MLGGSEINKVQKLEYLGVSLNIKGARAHDKAKEAEATQSRFKLRTTRAKPGEGEAAAQLKCTLWTRDGKGEECNSGWMACLVPL